MREIKFRAYNSQEKRMIQVESIDFDDMFVNNGFTVSKIMQYTGLKDKNGVEIFEGDVVKSEQWKPQVYEVVFNRGGFCLKIGEDSEFYPDIKYVEDFERIGNIHENPELLNN